MAMWYLVWLDPASTLYIYDSWPGVGICALQLGVLCWFTTTLLETRAYEEATSKRRFFLQIGALFTIYIISLPIIVLVASVLSPWVREKIVAAVSTGVDLKISARNLKSMVMFVMCTFQRTTTRGAWRLIQR